MTAAAAAVAVTAAAAAAATAAIAAAVAAAAASDPLQAGFHAVTQLLSQLADMPGCGMLCKQQHATWSFAIRSTLWRLSCSMATVALLQLPVHATAE